MLLLMKYKTAEASLRSLKACTAAQDSSNLDTQFSTARGISMLFLDDASISALKKDQFIVIPKTQGRSLRTSEFVLTITPPAFNATDEEKACCNDSAAWLSSITATGAMEE